MPLTLGQKFQRDKGKLISEIVWESRIGHSSSKNGANSIKNLVTCKVLTNMSYRAMIHVKKNKLYETSVKSVALFLYVQIS